jgi:diguanylate cyclase (GGDEF)-like protein
MRELRQTGKSFSLIMFDIDNFKKLNDQNGHSYGDEILQHVALVVSESLTENDSAARWGGEEFVVICNDSNLDRATRLAENIRQRVESDIQITCSFGVCEVGAESEFSEALDLVDECLYRAKQDGKNCVKTATCVGPTNNQPAALIQDSGNF